MSQHGGILSICVRKNLTKRNILLKSIIVLSYCEYIIIRGITIFIGFVDSIKP